MIIANSALKKPSTSSPSLPSPPAHLEESGVDDVEYAVDGEAGLCDVGGHDDLPLPLRRLLEDLALRLERHRAVHRQHHEGVTAVGDQPEV